VAGVAADPRHFAARTRHCRQVRQADLGSDALAETLLAWAGDWAGAVLVPCTDLAVSVVSRHQDRLRAHYRVGLPPHPVVEQLMDKAAFAAYAAEAGLALPQSFVLTGRADAERAGRELTFPAVLKPPVKSLAWTSRTKERAYVVRSGAELLETYDRIAGWAPTLLAQQWVPGDETELYSCNAYFDRAGQPLVTFVARKLRQWPPVTGTSAAGEECRNDEVLEQAVKLFSGLGFHGLAYLEMKRDVRTGQHYVIEPNIGRPTGRSAIAEGGGVELLHTMYCDLTGRPLPAERTQRYGRTVWFDLRRDAQAAWHGWRTGGLTPRSWLRSLQGPRVHAVWALDDPWPFCLDVTQTAAKALRRRSAG
jgi:predicted ATP-grasp superfamily ATP-dependent carboligase